jgi:hypothetical protein
MNTDPLSRLRQGLHRHFGPGAAVFIDTLLWLTGHVCVDIVRLDYWLQQRNPDYLDESMRGFILRKYGEKAERFVEYWIKGEPTSEHPSTATPSSAPVLISTHQQQKGEACHISQLLRPRSGT